MSDVLGRAVAAFAHPELRRDESVTAAAVESSADEALTFAAAVDVRGVDVRDADAQRGLDHHAAPLVVEPAPEVVRPQPDAGELDHAWSRPSSSASVSSSSAL